MPNRDAQRAALIAAVSGGASLRASALAVGVSRSTAAAWWAAFRPVAGGAGPDRPAGSPNQNDGPTYEERLAELLDASLATMLAQVRHMADPTWMREQPARDLGIAYGIVVDKAARLAALIERSRDAGRARGPGDDLDGPAEAGATP